MDMIFKKACGLDVHQKTIAACVQTEDSDKTREVRSYGTTTSDLESLKAWLLEKQVTHVAMESTGVYWKPVYNILEDSFHILLANARHIKHVPGRKTDIKDCEWICKLLRAGLLEGSFIPPKPIRELRDLVRYRSKLKQTITQEKNRICKVLEDGNVKLSSVLSDIFGSCGSFAIQALLDNQCSPEEMAPLLKKKGKNIKATESEIREALRNTITDHHRFMIQLHLDHIAALEEQLHQLMKRIQKQLEPYQDIQKLLTTIPGVGEEGAATLIAEIGADMDQFPDENHLSSWAGMSPGNNESAGKTKSGKTTKGSQHLRCTLVECSWAATRTKETYLASKYHSLAGRRGKKRALIAVGHKILIAAYFIIKYKAPYHELGQDWLDKTRKKSLIGVYLKKLTDLGCIVQPIQPSMA